MGGGKEVVLNRLVGTIHVRKGHLSSNLKKVREGARQVTPGASLLVDGIVGAEAPNCSVLFCFVFQKTLKGLLWLEWSKSRE